MAHDGVSKTVHATCIALGGRGALIRGPSGAGKSDIALRCLGVMRLPGRNSGCRAELVADDRVIVRRHEERLIAAPPPPLAGLIEVRGLGILSCPHIAETELALVINLTDSGQIDRFPDPLPRATLEGIALPALDLAPFEASAPIKLLMALERVVEGRSHLS